MAQYLANYGGYISLTYISGNTYQATITLYSSGNPYYHDSAYCANHQDSIYLHYGDGTTDIVYRSNGPVFPPDTVPAGDSLNSCESINMYTAKPHTFPGAGTYHIWYDDGIDAGYNIVNLPNSGGDDFYLENILTIDPFLGNESSTITLPNTLTPEACSGKCFYYNVNANIPNGDSISYSLGKLLIYGGVSAPGNFIPPGVYIDPVTGTISWCNPIVADIYDFAVYMVIYSPVNIGSQKLQRAIDTTEALLYITINSTCPTGINEINTYADYSIYPNPANNMIYLNSSYDGAKQVTLYDITGREISKTELSREQTEINISDLARGMYFVRVIETITRESYTLKLIKN